MKWDKTGMFVEVLQYHQYAVRMDGSGRLTTRNNPTPEATHPLQRLLPTIPLPPPTITHPHPTPPPQPPTYLSTPLPLPQPQIPPVMRPLPQTTPPSPPRTLPHTQMHPPGTQSPPRSALLSTPVDRRSYASVAGTSTPPHRPTQTAPKQLARMPTPYPSTWTKKEPERAQTSRPLQSMIVIPSARLSTDLGEDREHYVLHYNVQPLTHDPLPRACSLSYIHLLHTSLANDLYYISSPIWLRDGATRFSKVVQPASTEDESVRIGTYGDMYA